MDFSPTVTTGQRSSSTGGAAASVAAGDDLRESRRSTILFDFHSTTASEDSNSNNNTNNNSSSGLAVFTWGRGEDGQLGIGDTQDLHEPTFVDALRGIGVRQIACGSGHTVVLTIDGSVYTWGRGDDGRLGHGDNGWKYVPRLAQALTGKVITQVTCGSYHTAAVSNNGKLYTWGGGMYGKLGHGNENGCSTPKRVEALSDFNITQIACGSRHTAVVTSTGKLYTWGDKENGVAGHGDSEGHQYTPKLLEKFRDETIVQLSACGFHTGCITKDGEVFTWGEGKFGRLGHGNERNCHSPKLVETLIGKKPKQIACGGFHSAVIGEDGKMYTFGGGEHGQLGQGERINQEVPTLVKALDGIFISQITCGWSHSVALTSRGQVYTFGNGDHGKLGHAHFKKVSTPQIVEKLKNHKVITVASYNEHTAALVEPMNDSGAIWGAFGSNFSNVTVSSNFIRDMKEMVDNDEFADVTFVVNGEYVHAHRCLLASRCAHFAAMFRSGMRESVEREIHIPNVTKPVFLLLIEYLYTETVTVDVEHAVDLYILSDLYQLERLKNICINVIKRKISMDNAASILQASSDEGCCELKDICMEFIVTNFETFSKSDSIRSLSHCLLLEVLENRP